MEPRKKEKFLNFKDLLTNRANNLLFCFDGSITTISENRIYFFNQTFSGIYSIKSASAMREFTAITNKLNNTDNINGPKDGISRINNLGAIN